MWFTGICGRNNHEIKKQITVDPTGLNSQQMTGSKLHFLFPCKEEFQCGQKNDKCFHAMPMNPQQQQQTTTIQMGQQQGPGFEQGVPAPAYTPAPMPNQPPYTSKGTAPMRGAV